MLKRALQALESRLLLNLGTFLLIAAASLMLVEAWTRTFMNFSTPWIEEVVRYFVVWSVFLVFGFACRRGHYIRTELLVRAFSPRVQRAFGFVNVLTGLLFSSMLLWAGWVQIQHLRRLGMVSETMDLPMWIVKAGLIIGALSLVGYFVSRLIALFAGGEAYPSEAQAGSDD